MARRLKLGLIADERTDDISDEALYCRSYGHRWMTKPVSERRLLETLRNGYIENHRFCENGCGSEWSEIIDAKTFETLSTRRAYPKDYLIKSGHGRLARPDARKSRFVRQYPQFA